jgi:hypothetical protein
MENSAQRLSQVELAYVFKKADEESKKAIASILQTKIINRISTDLTQDERLGLVELLKEVTPYTKK